MKTAFIVLTYNRPDALIRVLQSLAIQCDSRHEVVVVDDGSTHSTLEALLACAPQFRCDVRHVWHPDTGFTASHSRNMGVADTLADYLVFLDGDCIPNPRFVDGHEALREAGCFVNGNRVLLSARLTNRVLSGSVNIDSASWTEWFFWRFQRDVNKLTHLLHLPKAPFRRQAQFHWKGIRSCNFGVWREDFVRVNGFDESFEGWGHEDADLVLRLHNAGLIRRNGYLSTEVYHLWHRENSRINESKNRELVNHRLSSGLFFAEIGLRETSKTPDFFSTKLN